MNLKPLLNYKFYIWLMFATLAVVLVSPFTVIRYTCSVIEVFFNTKLTRLSHKLSNWVINKQ